MSLPILCSVPTAGNALMEGLSENNLEGAPKSPASLRLYRGR